MHRHGRRPGLAFAFAFAFLLACDPGSSPAGPVPDGDRTAASTAADAEAVEPAASTRDPGRGSLAGLDDVTLLGLDGSTRALADLRGPITVVALWALWCKPCLEELPRLDALRDTLRSEGVDDVRFLAVSIDDADARERTRDKAEALGLKMPVVLDSEERLTGHLLAGADGATSLSLPQLIAIDGKGHMSRICGYEADGFEEHVTDLIAKAREGLEEPMVASNCSAKPPGPSAGVMKFQIPKKTKPELEAFRPELEKMVQSINPTLEGEALAEVVRYAEGQIEKGAMIEIPQPAPE